MRWTKKGQSRRVIERQRAEETGGGIWGGRSGGGAAVRKSQFYIMGVGDGGGATLRHLAEGGREIRPSKNVPICFVL